MKKFELAARRTYYQGVTVGCQTRSALSRAETVPVLAFAARPSEGSSAGGLCWPGLASRKSKGQVSLSLLNFLIFSFFWETGVAVAVLLSLLYSWCCDYKIKKYIEKCCINMSYFWLRRDRSHCSRRFCSKLCLFLIHDLIAAAICITV